MTSFQKAVRKKAKLRMAISGPSGSGKTMAALTIAKGLGGRVAVIDTENGSASLYADPVKRQDGIWTPPEFDVLELCPPYSPERFVEAIQQAAKAGYETLVVDSITHEWNGTGGVLELVDQVAKARFGGNGYMAWNDLTPRHRKFVDTIISSPMHVICTMRSKTEYDQITDDRNKKKVVKLGMKTEQRDGTDYEFTVVLDLVHDGHYATASKDRTGLFGGDPERISDETGKRLLDWLNAGATMLSLPPKEEPPVEEPVMLTDDELKDLGHRVIMAQGVLLQPMELEVNRLGKAGRITKERWDMLAYTILSKCVTECQELAEVDKLAKRIASYVSKSIVSSGNGDKLTAAINQRVSLIQNHEANQGAASDESAPTT